MRIASLLRLLPLLLVPFLAPRPASAAGETRPQVHHDLAVTLRPEAGVLEAEDRLTFPLGLAGLARTEKGGLKVLLHAALTLESMDPAFVVEGLGEEKAAAGEDAAPDALRVRAWDLRAASGALAADAAPRLRWKGKIQHPPVAEAEDYGRAFARTPGTIGADGAVLTRSTWWVPFLGEERLSFRLAVDLPAGWDAVSQGKRTEHRVAPEGTHVVWDCPHPMDEAYLIASRFTVYERPSGTFDALAYLRQPDPALAARYLEATAQYVEMYRSLIGPYPFEKFALVENFWETGYGMPSFTLLGSQVIRLPFILHSSYPHEILHNWWGNSVYVDWESGNWCEGLTAYMADHLIREGQGRGAEYRFDTLKKYRAYVRGGRDFPLTEFRSRHSGATEAVGYGKALMLFHMLRRRMGDDGFRKAMARFYRDFLWHSATFSDLAKVASEVAGDDLRPFFDAWVRRAGAPELALDVEAREGGVRITVRQVQEADPFPLRVPVAVTVAGRAEATLVEIDANERSVTKDVALLGVVRVDLDPESDVFRRLDAAEVPATLGEMFGAEKVTIVVPEETKDPMAAAWRAVAESWKGGGAQVEIVGEDALKALPADRAVWVLGSANAWSRAVAPALEAYGAGVKADEVEFGETRVPRREHSWVYVVRHPASESLAIAWAGSDLAAALPGFARKMPHYGKYSWLGFSGAEPTNVAKGSWTATSSPLVKVLAKGADGKVPARGSLPARPPLARLAPVFDVERLMGHVRYLADEKLEGRGAGSLGLEQATEYVAKAFADAGLKPGGENGTFFQVFEEPNGPDGKPVRMRNVVGVLPGTNPAWKTQSVVVGAHVDHLGRGWPDVRAGSEGKVHPGADDNASGVATLVETARALATEARPRTIVFVAFSGEEWGLKGSRHYVKAMQTWPVRDAIGMVNLDCVGRLFDRKLQVLGTGSAREWPFIVMGVAQTTGVDATGVPDDPQGSDQVAFREAGVPAVQLFSGAHEDYHRPTDRVEKLDPAGLVKAATFLRETVDYLASRPEPMHPAGAAPAAPPTSAEGGRKVLFGTVPDFAFAGPGIKVQSVVAGSPAEKAGMKGGDLLVALGGEVLQGLRQYSELLKRHAPGDVVHAKWTRDGKDMEADVPLVAR